MSLWRTSQKKLGIALLVLSIFGLVASFTLTYDTIEIIKNPDFNPACNVSPIVSCGKALASSQSELLGIPNPVYGILAFTALLTLAVTLMAGAKYKKWFWMLVETVAVGGVAGTLYLFFFSMYWLGSICPWCSLVWASTIAIFWLITTHLVATGFLAGKGASHRIADFWDKYAVPCLIVWYLALLAIVFIRFNDYWLSLI